MSVSGCGKVDTRPVVQHPPADYLTCPDEPLVNFDVTDDSAGTRYDEHVREAGASCRANLALVCRWHLAQGMTGLTCPQPVKPPQAPQTGDTAQ